MNIRVIGACCGLIFGASLVARANEPRDPLAKYFIHITLVADAPAKKPWGLRLVRVERDGTAYIWSSERGQICRVHPDGPDNEVPPFVLERTSWKKQTAKLKQFAD